MLSSYTLGAALVRDRFESLDPNGLRILDGLRREDIAVVGGDYDKIHLVFERGGIPFTSATPMGEEARSMDTAGPALCSSADS